MKLANEFIKYVVKELDMKSLPQNIKFVGESYSSQYLTFGTYTPSTDEIVIVKGNRHPVDVLRTLAHELVHHKQREDGKVLDGGDGSDIENEANAKAGELMRKFRTLHPGIFTNKLHTATDKLEAIVDVANSGVPRKIDEHYVDMFTAKLLLTTHKNLSRNNKERFLRESIPNMVVLAYNTVTK